jgi:hypothetical protein
MDRPVSFRIAGTYLEACNYDAICPCRTIDGTIGGRSTHGICYGALSWRIEEGEVRGIDLAGAGALMTYSYDDDEPRSPWTLVLYVDGAHELAEILLGRLGGKHVRTLPWVRKPTASVEVREARIEFGDGEVRVVDTIRLRATRPFETDSTVSCIVPGYDRPGTELINDEVVVNDLPFEFELRGTCAFTREFAYSAEATNAPTARPANRGPATAAMARPVARVELRGSRARLPFYRERSVRPNRRRIRRDASPRPEDRAGDSGGARRRHFRREHRRRLGLLRTDRPRGRPGRAVRAHDPAAASVAPTSSPRRS